MFYMINKGYLKEYFKFKNGYLNSIKFDNDILKDINKGYFFEIRGCKDCNRLYYNERLGSIIYNYLRFLN